MAKFIKQTILSLITALCVVHIAVWPVLAQTAGLLFVSPQQYFDNNGRPLSGGKVYYYQPGTLTFKNIWSDANETTPLTNPVTLDAAGRPNGAVAIYGEGNYRQIIKDANGNQIADLVTSSGGSGGGTSATGDGDLVGTIKPWAGLIAPNQYAFAYGQELNRTSYSALYTAITQSTLLTCNSGSPTLTNVTDTTQIRIGSAVELSCVAPGTTVISKTAITVTLSANSTLSTSATAIFFPYGNGNGSTTFNLPDLRGYVIAGRDNMGGIAASRLTTAYFDPGGTSDPDALGAPGGGQSHSLILGELAAHTHTGSFTNATGSGTTGTESVSHTHNSGSLKVSVGQGSHSHTASYPTSSSAQSGSGAAGVGSATPVGTSSATLPVLNVDTGNTGTESATHTHTFSFTNGAGSFTTNSTGSGTAFSIVQPSLTLNYIIKITPDTSSTVSTGVTSLGSMTGDIACGSGLTCTGNIISVSSGGVGTPGGPTTSVQFNNGGLFDGSANLTWVSPKLTIGEAGTTTGQLGISGNTSGTAILTVASAAGTPTLTLPTSTDTLIGKATTDILTNKTFNTAAAGNVFQINGTGITAISGNTGTVATTSGVLASGNCAKFDANGNIVDFGGSCGGSGAPGGSDTEIQYNNAGSFAGSANLSWVSPSLRIGVSGSATGQIILRGSTSGSITVTPQNTAGTATFTLPNTSGTPAISLPSPLALNATTGGGSWSGLTSGGVLYASSTTAVASSALLTANAIVLGGGAGVAPTTLGSLGTTTTVLHGNAAGAPTFGAVSLSADVTGSLALTSLAQIGANTVLSNWTGSTANVVANTWPSCSTTTSALQYTNGSGLSCYTSSASLAATGQTITGGAIVTSLSQSTGNITIDCGARPLQYITNGGAFTITAPANDGSCILLVTNNASAGTITFSGFSVGSNTGDTYATTNTNKYSLFVWRVNSTSGYRWSAHQ